TSHYVQNRACRIKGASRRKLGVRSFRLCENLDLATQLLQRLPIRNPTSLTADSAHNEQRELPVSDTSVVLVQVAQRRQTLRAEKVELLDQRSQLQQFAFCEVIVEEHFRLLFRNRLMRLPAELDGRFECNAKSLLHSVIETGQVTFKTVQEPCGSTTTQDLHAFVPQLRPLL